MAEQGNTTDSGPQEQENKKEQWWMDHVRQLVVGSPGTKNGNGQQPHSGPPAWALPHMTPPPLPPPPPPPPPAKPPIQAPVEAAPATQEPVPAAVEQAAPEPEQAEQPAQPEPELKGYTNKIPIAAILEFLSVNRQSGTLYLTNDKETFTLEILEGDIVHASSNLSSDEQLLGSILVARDKIGTEQLEDFYRRFSPNASPEDSGDYEELVSREDLKLALEAQVQELFNRLYAADDCSFCFYEGETSGVEQRIRMNVTRLLLESARNQDELERPDPVEPAPLMEPVEEAVEPDQDAPPGEMESFEEAGEFDDTVPFEGGGDYGATQPSEDMQPLDDTPPFDDSAPFDNNTPLDDTPRFDSEVPIGTTETTEPVEPIEPTETAELTEGTEGSEFTEFTENTEFKEYEGSIETGDEFDELIETDEVDPADRRDAV